MGVNSLLKTVTRQRRGYDLNPGPSAPESSTLTTRLPSHRTGLLYGQYQQNAVIRRSRHGIKLCNEVCLWQKLEPTRWVVVSGYDPVAGLVQLGAVAE